MDGTPAVTELPWIFTTVKLDTIPLTSPPAVKLIAVQLLALPDAVTPFGNCPLGHNVGLLKNAEAVLAFPFNAALIMLAEKLPLVSRITQVDGVLMDTQPNCVGVKVPPIWLNWSWPGVHIVPDQMNVWPEAFGAVADTGLFWIPTTVAEVVNPDRSPPTAVAMPEEDGAH